MKYTVASLKSKGLRISTPQDVEHNGVSSEEQSLEKGDMHEHNIITTNTPQTMAAGQMMAIQELAAQV